MAEVRLEHVYKRFGKVTAVKDFTLDIMDKEFLVLVGPSGCGKSTTLRVVAGLEEHDEGHVYIGDTLVDGLHPKERDIAMVFQNYALYPHMNAYDNMAFGLKLRRYSKDEIDQRVRHASRILGIEELLERKPGQLSGGQSQRVALGRAIVREPKVFLMDEPLSNLDAKLRVQMRTEISRLHQRLQTTVIYVTHDQTEAMTMGDRIVVMKDGEVRQVASPQELYGNPADRFVAGFIGSPEMNFFEGRLELDGGGLFFRDTTIDLEIPPDRVNLYGDQTGKVVALGIRPEDIFIDAEFLATHPAWTVRAEVEVVEPMGSETFLYLNSGTGTYTARITPDLPVAAGDAVEVAFNLEKMHIFDGETGETLTSRAGE